MAVEVKYSGKSMEQRVADRLKNSGDPRADVHVQKGEGPTRTHTNIHHAGHVYDKTTGAKPTDGTVDKKDSSMVGNVGSGDER